MENHENPMQGFPSSQFPVIFADTIGSISWGPGVTKMYLIRTDPNIGANGTQQNVPFAQLIMPLNGFVATALFFERTMKSMLEGGAITQEFVDSLRGTNDKPPAE